MPVTFRIPKLTDREIVTAFGKIRAALLPDRELKITVNIPHAGGIELAGNNPELAPQIRFVLDADSQIIHHFYLRDVSGNEVLAVTRAPEQIVDSTTLSDAWTNTRDESFRSQLPQLHVKVLASARRELRANDVEAAFKGTEENSWNRYRDAQTAVINSLQQATETLIIKASEKNAELDNARAVRFEKLESDMRTELERERKQLQTEFDKKQAQLLHREKQIGEKEAGFETKESHYVARQKQTQQIEKIQSWLDNWSLTKGTSRKRWPIASAYIVAMLFSAALTIYATWHSYDVLKSADEIVKLAWWQWAAIWSKSLFPLVAFATFIIYFIRWSGDWARQHSEEEFRNRTRLVDIGRSSWLLEAVRDAQERNKEIPADLLRELSRNLFATNAGPDKDLHPQAVSDLLLQGLSSLRVKSPDGSEVEATREKK